MKRKDIDNFLIELEKFISKNDFTEDFLQYTFMPVFKANINNIQTMWSAYKDIELPSLTKLVNKRLTVWKQRTSVFIRRLAYGIKYKIVNDFDYDNIFWKIVFNSTSEFTPKKIIKGHKKKIQTSFIIPEDWFHTNDIYIY